MRYLQAPDLHVCGAPRNLRKMGKTAGQKPAESPRNGETSPATAALRAPDLHVCDPCQRSCERGPLPAQSAPDADSARTRTRPTRSRAPGSAPRPNPGRLPANPPRAATSGPTCRPLTCTFATGRGTCRTTAKPQVRGPSSCGSAPERPPRPPDSGPLTCTFARPVGNRRTRGDDGRMPWSTTRPRSARYGREHRQARDAHMAALRAAGAGLCAETRNPGSRCLHRSAVITPAMRLHLCHDSVTGAVLGLGHADCNVADGARRGRARQHQQRHQQRPRRTPRMEW